MHLHINPATNGHAVERSFAKEVQALKLGAGEVFEGEGILAITKALLQAGVSYVGGYQGAPVSHLIDVMADAREILDDYGIHFEACANEAAAAAMCAASINYPMRGAVVWKSTVGTNVASDALSNLASAGVMGGTVIILGEDYGEGASIIQERSHAFALKSQLWLMDPRPDHARIVELVERAFELSEASHTPVMMEFRIRACHLHGRFVCKDNRRPAVSRNRLLHEPGFDFDRICLPPSTYVQEKQKIEARLPAAVDFIRRERLNETFDGDLDDVGIVLQGGLYNSVIRALQQLDLADVYGKSRIPIHALNVTYPLVPDEVAAFCNGKRTVLIVEEGQPAFLEEAIHAILRRHDVATTIVGKDVLPMAGEYTGEVLLNGIAKYLEGSVPPGVDIGRIGAETERIAALKSKAAELLGRPVPKRPPSFCTGCPERPVFSALKLVERDLGKIHIAADIGCHTFSTLPPFSLGNSVLGYGLGLASAAAVAPAFDRRVVSIMGDGGFWHNGLTSGVANAVFNRNDGILIIMNNGYSSATGQQYIPSSGKNFADEPSGQTIRHALRGVGVRWLKTVTTYRVGEMKRALTEAMTTAEKGLKVIIAESECQLARQRRIKPLIRRKLAEGVRVVRTRFGVDDTICTGDHSCIRLSGCPSLTVKPNPDPLRRDPVAHVDSGCVGCGLCGEVADAAVLCPSFYKAEIVQNPSVLDRRLDGLRRRIIRRLQDRAAP
jgi:indolepyruvate ferredoxin oxidoreductase alpha subunit